MPDNTPADSQTATCEAGLPKPQPLDYRPLIQSEIDAGELTQVEADAFLAALYRILESFVLDGQSLVPVDKLLKGFESAAAQHAPMVNSSHPNKINNSGGRYE